MQLDNIEIKWLGHSGFLIKGEKTIYIDPYQIDVNDKADLILITHSHHDHLSIEDINRIITNNTQIVIPNDCLSKLGKLSKEIKFAMLEPGMSVNIFGIDIKAVPAYNVNKHFHGKTEYWNGYVINPDGKKIYNAGDTDLIPEMGELEGIDIALLPVGGTYTMTAEEAARAAILIRPKVAIPMHFGKAVGSKEDALKFMEACEQDGVSCRVLEKQ